MLKGIDISMHNGTIDFNKVKSNGISIVIIKATEGVNYIDPYLIQHYNGAKAAGLNIGFYHFMSEKTNPFQQAIDFWNSIKDKEFNVLPCLDIETNNLGRSAKQISDRCIEFLQQFKALSGIDCIIYTGGYFGRDNLDSRVKKYKGWIAHYGVSNPMETGFEVVGHQFTEHGSINGVNGNVDINNFSEKIFIKEKEVKKVKNLVVYGEGPDKRAAEYLGDYLKAPIIEKNNIDQNIIATAGNIYMVGGKDKPDENAILISGSNRFDTMQAVLNFIKR